MSSRPLGRIRIMTKFNTPDNLYRYVAQTIQMLNGMNLRHAAEKLENVNSNFFTTGSEWLGELGLTIRAIEAEFSVPADVQERFNLIMAVVKDTWSKM